MDPCRRVTGTLNPSELCPHRFTGSSPVLSTYFTLRWRNGRRAASEAVYCGFESRSPHHYQSSDSSTDRMLGYEPGDVGSIPPLTTISQASFLPSPLALYPLPTCQLVNLPASCPFWPTGQLINRSTDAPILDTPYSILQLSGP